MTSPIADRSGLSNSSAVEPTALRRIRQWRTVLVTAVHLLIDTAMRRGVPMGATGITWSFNDFSVTYIRSVHHA
jgi:hypothetical protein